MLRITHSRLWTKSYLQKCVINSYPPNPFGYCVRGNHVLLSNTWTSRFSRLVKHDYTHSYVPNPRGIKRRMPNCCVGWHSSQKIGTRVPSQGIRWNVSGAVHINLWKMVAWPVPVKFRKSADTRRENDLTMNLLLLLRCRKAAPRSRRPTNWCTQIGKLRRHHIGQWKVSG